MYGSLEVNKVAGNFHFAPGKSFHLSNAHVLELLAFQMDNYNVRYCLILFRIKYFMMILLILN